MNDLIRPTLYDAYHEIWPVLQAAPDDARQAYNVVGPICESSDYFAKERLLPDIAEGDLMAIMTAGAYGAVQSSGYNSRLLVPEVLVNGDRWAIVRSRPDYAEMLKAETLAPWQG